MKYRIKRKDGQYYACGYTAQHQEQFTEDPSWAAIGDETTCLIVANLLRDNGHDVEVEPIPCNPILEAAIWT